MDALAEELRSLPRDARRVLEAAAVVGDPFGPELVAAAAGMDEDEVAEALDALLAADLVRPTAAPRRFGVRHPLVRCAVYESVGGGRRLRVHGGRWSGPVPRNRFGSELLAAGAQRPAVPERVADDAVGLTP